MGHLTAKTLERYPKTGYQTEFYGLRKDQYWALDRRLNKRLTIHPPWPSYFNCKVVTKYFRALESRNTAVSYLFMPKLSLAELPDGNKSCQKWPNHCGSCPLCGLLKCSVGHYIFHNVSVDMIEACGSYTAVCGPEIRHLMPKTAGDFRS